MIRTTKWMIATTACALLLAGCRDEKVRVYDAPKESHSAAMDTTEDGAAEAPFAAMTWQLPAGWRIDDTPRQMRWATIMAPSQTGEVEIAISNFPGTVGGHLANVNRWRGQMGLPPVSGEEVLSELRKIPTAQGTGILVDLVGPEPTDGTKQQRMLVVMIPREHRTWFIKLFGPVEAIADIENKFEQFVASVGFEGDQGMMPPATQPQKVRRIVKYDTPDGWTAIPGQEEPRVLVFKVAGHEPPLEVAVTRWTGAIGTLLENVNRWRRQVGLPPVANLGDQHGRQFRIPGGGGTLLDFQGPASRQLVGMIVLNTEPQQKWVTKLMGAPDAVGRQAEAFEKFVLSIELGVVDE